MNPVRILVVSDSHGSMWNMRELMEKVGKVDRILHLGDLECSREQFEAFVKVPVEAVKGNCDSYLNLPDEKILEIGGYRILMTHGHRYYVSYGTKELEEKARKENCHAVFYGHTHTQELIRREDLVILNPGSISKPRPSGAYPGYALLEIDRMGEAHYTLCRLAPY